jgi:hypothetical protein
METISGKFIVYNKFKYAMYEEVEKEQQEKEDTEINTEMKVRKRRRDLELEEKENNRKASEENNNVNTEIKIRKRKRNLEMEEKEGNQKTNKENNKVNTKMEINQKEREPGEIVKKERSSKEKSKKEAVVKDELEKEGSEVFTPLLRLRQDYQKRGIYKEFVFGETNKEKAHSNENYRIIKREVEEKKKKNLKNNFDGSEELGIIVNSNIFPPLIFMGRAQKDYFGIYKTELILHVSRIKW